MKIYIVQKCFYVAYMDYILGSYNRFNRTNVDTEPIMVTDNYEEAKSAVDNYFTYIPGNKYAFKELDKSSEEYDECSLGGFCGACECVYERIKKMSNNTVFSYTILMADVEEKE